MKKQVLSVGQCIPDDGALLRFLSSHFDVEMTRSIDGEDALARMRSKSFDLVLINRKLDADYSEGSEVLDSIKSDDSLKDVPVMLITNYPDAQQRAVAAGAEYGFGKLEYDKPEVIERVGKFLAS